ncbi:MAG: hypothetical protein GX040_11255 [Alcaligenaceae bacterium]|nr:hypothetical protein [Alcaligenaceae bacterium]
MSLLPKMLIASTLISPFANAVQAKTVKEVFNGDMLGTTQRYFESIAGIPRKSSGNEHSFRVQGCNITATIDNNDVSALRIELNDKCQADLSTFIDSYAPPANTPLTVGAFEFDNFTFMADCLGMCGNAYDPSVYALWEGPHAINFMEVLLEFKLVSDAAIDAATAWKNHMEQAAGENYVMDARFNCDDRFNTQGYNAFKKVTPTAITIGHGLSTLRSDCAK